MFITLTVFLTLHDYLNTLHVIRNMLHTNFKLYIVMYIIQIYLFKFISCKYNK